MMTMTFREAEKITTWYGEGFEFTYLTDTTWRDRDKEGKRRYWKKIGYANTRQELVGILNEWTGKGYSAAIKKTANGYAVGVQTTY